MTDIEIVRLCAEAMGMSADPDNSRFYVGSMLYDPLHDDAQAMALLWFLIGKGTVTVSAFGFKFHDDVKPFLYHKMESKEVFFRAICECVAAMRVGKVKV